jgi:hypothetical protein
VETARPDIRQTKREPAATGFVFLWINIEGGEFPPLGTDCGESQLKSHCVCHVLPFEANFLLTRANASVGGAKASPRHAMLQNSGNSSLSMIKCWLSR